MISTLAKLRALHPVEAIVHLDFESYYSAEYTLRKLTNEAYVRDPRFEASGVGVQINRGEPVWLEEWDFRAWAKRVDWSRCAVNAHHTQFDGFILSHHYDVHPAFLLDTLSMSRALHSGAHDLATLGPMYGLGEKGNELEAVKGKRRADLTQAEWLRLGEYCKQDVRLTAGLFYAMKPKLPAAELWQIDSTIRMFTEPRFVGNQEILAAALLDEQTRKAALISRIVKWASVAPEVEIKDPVAALAAAKRKPSRVSRKPAPTPEEIAKKVLGSSDKFAALLVSLGESPPTKYNDKGETIYAFAKDDPGMQELLESPREDENGERLIQQLAEARISVKSNVDETRVQRFLATARRGTMPVYLKIYGAHTHRWAGGDKNNWQNLRRGGQLRAAVEAAEGWVLVVVDSGQIEARVAPWFAGETALIESFRRNDATGGDFYSDEGSKFFLMKISKKDTPTERQLSKNMILGLGFGMGWATFATNLLAGMLGSAPVQFTLKEASRFGVDVAAFEARKYGWGEGGGTCGQQVQQMIANGARLAYSDLLIHSAVADHFTRRYRAAYPKIAQCWKACERVIEVMARELGEGEDPSAARMDFGCLKVIHRGLVKPNGLTLHYPGLRKTSGGYAYKGGASGREWVSLYGGKLFENIVQSLARDIVAEQMLRIRADGHHLGTCTHDEAVAIVPESRGAEVFAAAVEHFRTAPAWCADLPLNASGGFARSYGSVK